jgi:hypothetical protein
MADDTRFTMPIMIRSAPKTSFTWAPTERDRRRADRNHGQTLERLRERGGLCWEEMLACLLDKGLWDEKFPDAEARCCAEIESRLPPQHKAD